MKNKTENRNDDLSNEILEISEHVSILFHIPVEIEIGIKKSNLIIEKMYESIHKLDLSIVEPYLDDKVVNGNKYKFLARVKRHLDNALKIKSAGEEIYLEQKKGSCIFGSTCKLNSGKYTKDVALEAFRFLRVGEINSFDKFGIIIEKDEYGIIKEMMLCGAPRFDWRQKN